MERIVLRYSKFVKSNDVKFSLHDIIDNEYVGETFEPNDLYCFESDTEYCICSIEYFDANSKWLTSNMCIYISKGKKEYDIQLSFGFTRFLKTDTRFNKVYTVNINGIVNFINRCIMAQDCKEVPTYLAASTYMIQ